MNLHTTYNNSLFFTFFIQEYAKQTDDTRSYFESRRFCASFIRSVWALGLLRCLFNICFITNIALFKTLSARLRLCFSQSFVCCCLTSNCKGRESRGFGCETVSYTHLRAHETGRNLVCRLLL